MAITRNIEGQGRTGLRSRRKDPRESAARSAPPAYAVDLNSSGIDPSPIRIASSPRQLSDLRPLYEINERCLELLVRVAQTELPTFPLVCYLRELLLSLTPEMRARVTHRPLLLVDMQFASGELWRTVKDNPSRPMPGPAWQGNFPRPSAVQLAESTLSFAWHTVHAAPQEVCLLGMTTDVADIIGELSITEIASVAKGLFRHVRPRWEDRPAVWRRMILSSRSKDPWRAREFSLYSVQLLTADLISPVARSRNAS